MAKVVPTLFGELQNNSNISKGRKTGTYIPDQKIGCFSSLKYCQRLWKKDNPYNHGIISGCCTSLLVLFASWKQRYYWQGIWILIEKGEMGTLKKEMAETERMLKALVNSLETNP